MEAKRHEAAARVKVRRIELQRGHYDDGEHRHQRFPNDDDHVAVGQELSAAKIHRGKQNHQPDCDRQSFSIEQTGILTDLINHVEVLVDPGHAVDIGDDGQHLDGRDEDSL